MFSSLRERIYILMSAYIRVRNRCCSLGRVLVGKSCHRMWLDLPKFFAVSDDYSMYDVSLIIIAMFLCVVSLVSCWP